MKKGEHRKNRKYERKEGENIESMKWVDTLVFQRRMLAVPPLISLQVNPVMQLLEPLLVNKISLYSVVSF